jgi:hypothetical protein
MAEPAVKTESAAVKAEPAAAVKHDAGAEAAKGGAGLPALDGAMFFRRLQNLYRLWKENKQSAGWADVDAFCVLAGRAQQDESAYRKSAVLQIYLLGFLEFPETLMVFTPQKLFVLTSGKKCKFSVRVRLIAFCALG